MVSPVARALDSLLAELVEVYRWWWPLAALGVCLLAGICARGPA